MSDCGHLNHGKRGKNCGCIPSTAVSLQSPLLDFAERLERASAVGPTHFGRCGRCHLPWDVVRELGGKTHDTQFCRGAALFALCEQCWQELGDPAARMPFYRALWLMWKRQEADDIPDSDLTPEGWARIEAAVLEGK